MTLTISACDTNTLPSRELAELTPCEPLPSGVLSPEHVLHDAESLSRLAHLPDDEYRTRLASSYDRSSVSPSLPGWFANHDASGSYGTFQGERVMLETDGPGVITRIWSANPSGRIKIYFDGETTPRIDASFSALLAQGELDSGVSLNARIGGADTLFTALVFTSHVVVTTTSEDSYFAVDYRVYSNALSVQPDFDGENETSRCHLANARARITGTPQAQPFSPSSSFALATGASHVIPASSLGSVLSRVRVTGLADLSQDAMPTLQVSFDGELTIEGPVDRILLFDAEGDPVRGHGLVTSPAAGSAELTFPMPFATEASFALKGDAAVTLYFDVLEEAEPFTERSLLFHARWTGPQTFDVYYKRDLDVVTVEGSGFYVGTGLRVHNPSRAWWGEGDEKIWVDDDTFPSHFGTGTEDYFGYAFCATRRFAHAYFGQNRSNFTNYGGVTALYRFHIVDAIRFRSAIDFDLEIAHWEYANCHTDVTYDATSYFYARPGATVDDVWHEGESASPPTLPEGMIEHEGANTTCHSLGQPFTCH